MKNSEFIEIPELRIKVQLSLSLSMKYSKTDEYCADQGARMLNVLEAGYIYDNDLIKDFCEKREWLEHYSKKAKEFGFGCSASNSNCNCWEFPPKLFINGFSCRDENNDFVLGRVRLVFPLKD